MDVWLQAHVASYLSNKAERTLRLHAIKGQLTVKKEKGKWFFSWDCLHQQGANPPLQKVEELHTKGLISEESKNIILKSLILPTSASNADKNNSKSNKERSKKRITRTTEMGLYQEILQLIKELKLATAPANYKQAILYLYSAWS